MNPASILYLYLNPSSDLYAKYKEKAEQHNVLKAFPDAGFDVFTPTTAELLPFKSTKIDFEIIGAMYELSESGETLYSKPQSFYMYPRSSISKSNFRLANNVGIIDSGYRGNLGAYFDTFSYYSDSYVMEKMSRYIQLCNSRLEPFKVVIVDNVELLGEPTDRGTGGFGSTGL